MYRKLQKKAREKLAADAEAALRAADPEAAARLDEEQARKLVTARMTLKYRNTGLNEKHRCMSGGMSTV